LGRHGGAASTEAFYSVFHAVVTDKFGVTWNVVAAKAPERKGVA
jgi:uncharacterized glyoxalase superfamily protein PhnB